MTTRIFIDGAAGTTGLEIRERLKPRKEIELVTLPDAQRKDELARREALNDADIVILCLPDDAARAAVEMIDNPMTRILDPSSAHRTAEGWVYGFPEMEKKQREAIRHATKVTNPGCYALCFVALMHPLTRAGLIPPAHPITVNAVSGYSGGGHNMIAEFEDKNAPSYVDTVFRTYGLALEHKHVEEMRVHGGLAQRPLFAPSVGRYYRGMMVDVPLQLWALPGTPKPARLYQALADAYSGEKLIEVVPPAQAATLKTLDAEEMKGTDRLKIYVFGNEARQQARLVAVVDNLGKGAAGSTVQNLNAMMGWPETTGLVF
jgi:N-acetyl-gamma-glutamyl-phosphate reductase